MATNRLVLLPLLSVLILSLTACIGGKTPPPKFYLLEPISSIEYQASAGVGQNPVVYLKPVRIPHYVDRPQIVTSTARNAYELSEFHRWAESLDHNIGRVLARNFGILVPAEVRFSNPPTSDGRTNFRVSVEILEFHADPKRQAGLTAQWRIARGGDLLVDRQKSYREPAAISGYPGIVAALNLCLDRLSSDMASELRNLASSNR
ncbi:uncharacterized protein sS8_1606 [Methylocaldum marinum]|uniref:ABC-type transport auxiliary lipoprotein component domain-containing protein n=1 Tax=Methylocaldum marinum TaxID=1432792 RepID=A0A250KPT5_9GAMM|nr:PqiC family protein [Methylocaldum marinum]BBA33564.1 uncharacterized protein sS8_1606 [Methylocaldum marinum]